MSNNKHGLQNEEDYPTDTPIHRERNPHEGCWAQMVNPGSEDNRQDGSGQKRRKVEGESSSIPYYASDEQSQQVLGSQLVPVTFLHGHGHSGTSGLAGPPVFRNPHIPQASFPEAQPLLFMNSTDLQNTTQGIPFHQHLSAESWGATGSIPGNLFRPQFLADLSVPLLSQALLSTQLGSVTPLLSQALLSTQLGAPIAFREVFPPVEVNQVPVQEPKAEREVTGRPPILLYMNCDDESLSQYQCLVRKQIELFEASPDDIKMSAQGRNHPIVIGQVGIRCRHCGMLPSEYRTRGAVYYPARKSGLYQAAQNLASIHLLATCESIPAATRERLKSLRDSKSPAGCGKRYWANGVAVLGVHEDSDGLRFEKHP